MTQKPRSLLPDESNFGLRRNRTCSVTIAALALIVLTTLANGSKSQEALRSAESVPPAKSEELGRYISAFPFDDFEIVEVPNMGKFYIDPNAKGLVRSALRTGRPHAAGLIDVFESHVNPGTTAIDVGAHIGSLTVPLARLVGPEGRVYAFEPQRKVYRELYHNLQLNGFTHATAFQFAVSSKPGFLEMMALDAPWSEDGWGRLGKGGERVEARTLDSFHFTDVSLIKIDVEGHEVEVVKGAEQTIRTFHPVLVIETGKQNLLTLKPMLADWGYDLQKIEKSWADYLAIYRDGETATPSKTD